MAGIDTPSDSRELATFQQICRFCSRCDSHLLAERLDQPHVILRVATLDDGPGATPVMHIGRLHDVAGLRDATDVESYDEWQPGR